MKYIHIKGQWCDIKYHPVSKRDTGLKFLKAIRRIQIFRAKKELINNISLKIEIVN